MSNPLATITNTQLAITGSPLDHRPAVVYLAALQSARSRRVMADALNNIAGKVLGVEPLLIDKPDGVRRKTQDVTYLSVQWEALRAQHTKAIQSRLAESYRPATVNRMIAALRGVLKAAYELELMTADDYHRATALKPVKGETLPAGRDILQGELLALVEVCKADPKKTGLRDAAVIGILYTCGLRRSELVGLELADYEPDTGLLNVRHGKGRQERRVYVKGGAARALAAWLNIRGHEPGALFMPITKGGTIQPRPMTDQAIYNLLHTRGADAKLKDFSPHDFRRTFVGDLLDRGVDIVTVQKLAGHASPTTTGRYDRRPEKVKEDAISKLHFPF